MAKGDRNEGLRVFAHDAATERAAGLPSSPRGRLYRSGFGVFCERHADEHNRGSPSV